MKSTLTYITAASLGLLGTSAYSAPSTAGLWLRSHLKGGALVCSSSKTPSFKFTANSGEIFVQAHTTGRGESYSVSHVSFSSTQLKVSLSNDVDGPLAQDLIVVELNALFVGAADRTSSFTAWDIYSEQYDGTTQKIKLTCRIE